MRDSCRSVRPVHPHACGEHAGASSELTINAGSSPRMWGTPFRDVCSCYFSRFIPTHVGNTSRNPARSNVCPVHPHACGEHTSRRFEILLSVGSSPRMWGTLEYDPEALAEARFIPTHVGNTPSHIPNRRMGTVHPHACGEHPRLARRFLFFFGSSPRMWGTPTHHYEHWTQNRFIPTHVGNT